MTQLIQEKVNKNDPAFFYLKLHPNEDIFLLVRHHWIGMLPTILVVLGMLVLPAFFLFSLSLFNVDLLSEYYRLIVLGISSFVLFLLTFSFGSWINFYYDIIFVTDMRVINIAQEGLLSRNISELTLSQIQNVSAKQHGFVQSFFNTGTLIIETAGAGTSDDPHHSGLQGYFTVTDVPDPNRVARIILELQRRTPEEAVPEKMIVGE